MSQEIHGHEVMDRMQASGRTFTRQSLAAFIVAEFGADTRFFTCTHADLSAAELVDFLAARGKFAGPAEAFTLNPHGACRH